MSKQLIQKIWPTMDLPAGGATDIEVNPMDMDKIIITIGNYNNDSKVFSSNDARDTWTNQSSDLHKDIS